jgi:hypothetical protein
MLKDLTRGYCMEPVTKWWGDDHDNAMTGVERETERGLFGGYFLIVPVDSRALEYRLERAINVSHLLRTIDRYCKRMRNLRLTPAEEKHTGALGFMVVKPSEEICVSQYWVKEQIQ